MASPLAAARRFRRIPGGWQFSTRNHLFKATDYGREGPSALTGAGDPLGWHLPAADEQRALLFDLRRAAAPVLQWDHCMEGCPPHLLQVRRRRHNNHPRSIGINRMIVSIL